MRADWDTMPLQECGLNIDDGYINKTLSETVDVWYTRETEAAQLKANSHGQESEAATKRRFCWDKSHH